MKQKEQLEARVLLGSIADPAGLADDPVYALAWGMLVVGNPLLASVVLPTMLRKP